MTTPLEKPVRRLVQIRGGVGVKEYVATLSYQGVELREKGRKSSSSLSAPWSSILGLAERLAGEYRHREQLRAAAVRRISKDRR